MVHRLAGLSKNAMAFATSRAIPSPSGIFASSAENCSSVSCARNLSVISDCTRAGATQFTRMFLGANSIANERVRPPIAALLAL